MHVASHFVTMSEQKSNQHRLLFMATPVCVIVGVHLIGVIVELGLTVPVIIVFTTVLFVVWIHLVGMIVELSLTVLVIIDAAAPIRSIVGIHLVCMVVEVSLGIPSTAAMTPCLFSSRNVSFCAFPTLGLKPKTQTMVNKIRKARMIFMILITNGL